MKRITGMRWGMAFVLVCSLTAYAGDKNDKDQDKDKDKAKQPPAQAVDSGAFGVFVKGQRVVTESFSVQQQGGSSIIKSQLKETPGAATNLQNSEMQIMANAQLVRYEWNETTPAVSSVVVTPSNEFLIEKITTPSSTKPAEQPFLMPNTSVILDNNFFVHREVLLWRYLATAPCHDVGGNRQCEPQEYGVLVPQDRTSMRVRVALVGKEKVSVRGTERELLRLNLTGDGFNWSLWVDGNDQFKLMRVAIPADNTEVVRD